MSQRGASVASSGWSLLRLALRAVLPFVLVAGVIALRFPATLLRAEFWAEDATEFFFDAIALGPRSLFAPVYGYHFFIEHLIAYAATFARVFHTPYVYAWSCLFIDAFALAYLARDGFSWILPSRWQRVVLAMLLALGPGTPDVLLNLTNLPNPLALLAFLLLVERPHRMGAWKLLAFTLIAASSGHVLVWLPIAAYLALVYRSRGYSAAAFVIAAFGILNGIGAHAASTSARISNLRALPVVPLILVENGFARLLPVPFCGMEFAQTFQLAPGTIYWSAAAAGLAGFAWLAVREFRHDRHGTVVLLLGYAGAIGMLGLIAISRSRSVSLLMRESGTLLPVARYSFLPAALASLIWLSWLLRPRAGGLPGRVVRCALAAIVGYRLAMGVYFGVPRPDLLWRERSSRVQWLLDVNRTTGSPVVISIDDLPIHPVRWVPDNGRVAVVVPGH